jgi:predicted chitinase
MKKKLIITESEKNEIKRMYNLNESDSLSDIVLNKTDFLQNVIDSAKKHLKDKPSQIDTDFNTVSFNANEKEMIKYIVDEMKNEGIKDPLQQIGILSVIKKESGFKPQNEISYSNTSNSRIRSIFGNRVSKFSDEELNTLKKDDKLFFETVYGKDSGVRLGNTEPGDGWKYIGRGLNGLTGRSNYKKYGDMIGVDLISNPDLVNKPEISAKIAIKFLTKDKPASSLPKFKSKEEAAEYFANINAGGESKFSSDKAIAASKSFNVDDFA